MPKIPRTGARLECKGEDENGPIFFVEENEFFSGAVNHPEDALRPLVFLYVSDNLTVKLKIDRQVAIGYDVDRSGIYRSLVWRLDFDELVVSFEGRAEKNRAELSYERFLDLRDDLVCALTYCLIGLMRFL